LESASTEARRATLIGTLTQAPTPAGLAGAAGADWLEVRADLVGDLDPAVLTGWRGRLLYTLRSRGEGGAFDGRDERRRRRLLAAAERFDRIDLEGNRDLVPEILEAIPPERRVISWHGAATDAAGLREIFGRMARVEAALYKLVPHATQAGDELAPLQLLAELRRRDVIAFARGAAGTWTRLVAPRLAAPVIYGATFGLAGAPGQPSLASLIADFGLPELRPVDRLFGIVGNPVSHSLSPRLHNAAYRALGIPALFLPFHAASFGDFWLETVESGVLEALDLPLRGLSVTAPFKEAALAVSGAESPLAARIGAANTLVPRDGVWEAESTDPAGIVRPLEGRGLALRGARAVVVGAGGGGRSAAVGLGVAGATVTLANRGTDRGRLAAASLGVAFQPLGEVDASCFDVLVNATALGRGDADELPFSLAGLRSGAAVVDLVYPAVPPGEAPPADHLATRLLRQAAALGAVTIGGREVLLEQAREQFALMNGVELPIGLARQVLSLDAADLPAGGQG
jgi:3-dehydroquinate dehydratase/shikimate dehydrogenase